MSLDYAIYVRIYQAFGCLSTAQISPKYFTFLYVYLQGF